MYCSICGRRYLDGEKYCLKCGSIRTTQSVCLNPLPCKQTTSQVVLSLQELEGETEVLTSPFDSSSDCISDEVTVSDNEQAQLLTAGMLPIQFRGFNNSSPQKASVKERSTNGVNVYAILICIIVMILIVIFIILFRELR